MKFIALVVSLTCLSSLLAPGAQAWNEPNAVLGVPWGASRPETLKILLKRSQDSTVPKDMRDVFRPECPNGNPDLCLMATYIGPVIVLARFWFPHGKFATAHLTLDFNPTDYANLRQIFIERYGSPTSTTTGKVKTKIGGEFPDEKLSWSGPKVFILLEKYCCDTTKTSLATLMLQSEAAKAADEQRRRLEKGKKDL